MTSGAAAAKDALRLSGRPPLLAGAVVVRNDTDRPVTLEPQEASLRADDGTAVRAALNFIGFVAPKSATRIPIHLVVDAGTPAGRYRGDVVIGDAPQALDVAVLDVVRVTISPHVLTIRAAAGESIEAEFSVSNDGNVVQQLPAEVVVGYEQPDSIDRAIDIAVHETGPEEGALGYLDRFARALRASTSAKSTAAVDAPGAKLVPGSQTIVRISTVLPAELAAGSYYGSFTLADIDVGLEIDVTPAANSTKRRTA